MEPPEIIHHSLFIDAKYLVDNDSNSQALMKVNLDIEGSSNNKPLVCNEDKQEEDFNQRKEQDLALEFVNEGRKRQKRRKRQRRRKSQRP